MNAEPRQSSPRPCVDRDTKIRILSSLLVAAAVVALQGCDGTKGNDGLDAGMCTQPLEQQQPFGGCPTQFDDTSWKDNVCFLPATVTEQSCSSFRSRSFGFGTHSFTCYYDAASGTLTGAEFHDDVPSFCDHSSSGLYAGVIPALVGCNAPEEKPDACTTADAGVQRSCPPSAYFVSCVHSCGEAIDHAPAFATCSDGIYSCPSGLVAAADCPAGSWPDGQACGPWPNGVDCANGSRGICVDVFWGCENTDAGAAD